MSQRSKPNNNAQLFLYFGLVFAISWGIWIPLCLIGGRVNVTGSVALGAIVPSVVGIALSMLFLRGPDRKDFWVRAISPKRIPGRWYLLIFLLFPLSMTIAFGVNRVLFGSTPSLSGLVHTLTSPTDLVVFIVVMLVGGPLAEEFGWRGYALDRLMSRFRLLPSSVILGIIWFVWHLPLFFMVGTTQHE